MNYEYASENIIICKNYLPDHMLQKIHIDLMNNRTNFKASSWGHGKDYGDEHTEFFSSFCGGFEYWIREDEVVPNNEAIMGLDQWFYHQGFFRYLRNAGRLNVFQLLKKKKTHKIHVMSYNNGGYYNWHTDTEYFTFNLILNQGNELKGGDMMFMDDGHVVEIPNQNNMMVVFPSYINHAITPLKSEDGKDVPFPQQRFSIQYWVKCN